MRTRLLPGLALSSALLLSACASFSPDRGMDAVSGIAGTELKKDVVALRSADDAATARMIVDRLLKKPLTVEDAVQIAVLSNRDLQAAYNVLGLAEADRVRASLPPNPRFSLERLAGGGELEIERRIVANILSLATLPARAAIAADRFHQAQLQAVEATLRIAAETRRAYFRAVAARELAGYLAEARAAADTANELAKRLGESGAMNKLDQARNQVFAAELTAQLASTRNRTEAERERLIRLMGLWGRALAFKLPRSLPSLPSRARGLASVETEAVARRVDLQIARIEIEALAKSYDLTGATRFLNLLEVAGISKTTTDAVGDKTRQRGFEVEFEIPLFDFGEVRARQAEEQYMQAVNRLVAKAVNVRSEAREAYQAYRSAYDVARHYRREILPLRKIISEETLLRYNAMQIDVFELFSEVRQRINSTAAALEAQRDFWIAEADLRTALIGGANGSASTTATMMQTAAEPSGGH
ncbi:MAG: TolC family protein [Rhizobiales bacterium]|nr:TolC family protein [Hyphomicrobiales bacterium]